MTLEDLAKPGDKIDIRLIQQKERMKRGEEGTVVYKSSILDFLPDNEVEISMPTESGKIILFQVGQRCAMMVYTSKGMYNCIGRVQKRYKKGNLYMLSVLLMEEPKKFQRREFFRIDCSLEMQYYRISEEIAEFSTTDELVRVTYDPEYIITMRDAHIMDISGGGMRFLAKECLESESYILSRIHLVRAGINQTFYLVTQIIAADLASDGSGQYIHRSKFIFKDLKDRETIVRYVFEEERRIRKRENG